MSTRRRTPFRAVVRPVIAAATAAVLCFGLTACAGSPGSGASPSHDASATGSPAAPEPSVPAEPTLLLDGTASENLPFFAGVVDRVWASEERGSGRAYVDALVAGGFDKSTMQVTKDLSTVGNAAESMQVSAIWAGECLVGQFGSATGAPFSSVQATLPGEVCLLGNTRPIDW